MGSILHQGDAFVVNAIQRQDTPDYTKALKSLHNTQDMLNSNNNSVNNLVTQQLMAHKTLNTHVTSITSRGSSIPEGS